MSSVHWTPRFLKSDWIFPDFPSASPRMLVFQLRFPRTTQDFLWRSRVKGVRDRLRKRERERERDVVSSARKQSCVHLLLFPRIRSVRGWSLDEGYRRIPAISLLTETKIPAVLCLACRRVISNTLEKKNQVVHLHARVIELRQLADVPPRRYLIVGG